MRGHLIDLCFGLNRKQRITIEVDGDFREVYKSLKGIELDVKIEKHRNRRSRSENGLFHALVGKIAAASCCSEETTKTWLVCKYGALMKDQEGQTVGFKLPASADVSMIYPYAKCFDTREESGKLFNCYMVYKKTHDMDSEEMSRLITGAIQEAQKLGIDTSP